MRAVKMKVAGLVQIMTKETVLSVPAEIFDTNITAISSDEGSTLFIKNDNSLWATGWNSWTVGSWQHNRCEYSHKNRR